MERTKDLWLYIIKQFGKSRILVSKISSIVFIDLSEEPGVDDVAMSKMISTWSLKSSIRPNNPHKLTCIDSSSPSKKSARLYAR